MNVYGNEIRRHNKFADSQMMKVVNRLHEYKRNGIIVSMSNMSTLTDATFQKNVWSVGNPVDIDDIDDEKLFQSYIRVQAIAVLEKHLKDLRNSGDYWGKAYQSTLEAIKHTARISDGASRATQYGGEASFLTAQNLVYKCLVDEAAEKAAGKSMTCGIPMMDEYSLSPARREVMLLVGESGSCKSFFIDNLAVQNAARGYNVVLITLETSCVDRLKRIETMATKSVHHKVHTRVKEDSNIVVDRAGRWRTPRFVSGVFYDKVLTDRPVYAPASKLWGDNALHKVDGFMVGEDGNIDQRTYDISTRVRKLFKENGGDIRVNAMPIQKTTADDISKYLDELAENGFAVDILVVDYMALMRDSLGSTQYIEKMMNLSQEIKDLAQKYNCAVVNVHQAKYVQSSQRKSSKITFGEMTLIRDEVISPLTIYGAKLIINEVGIGLGLNVLDTENHGLVINVFKVRNSSKPGMVFAIRTGLPAKFCADIQSYPYVGGGDE